ncbi:MAG: Rrf2 family transcriptional regulator [Anaerolineae bacterium]|nr:MAG: Rrf2 family transcriptional regulator [Anaerolineae bacterium]
MKRLTRQTDYAIRVLLALARRGPEARLSTAEIRQEMLIPPALSARIVAELARGEFILTYPGRDGGIRLARPPAKITLLEVVEFFEGPIHVSECIEGKVDCPFEANCPVRRRWARIDDLLRQELQMTTFQELAEEAGLISDAEANSTTTEGR